MNVTVLDDYQAAAAGSADWAGLDAEIDFVHDHLSGDELVQRLAQTQVLVCMRERTALPRELVARLPKLELVVTTGMRNASIAADALSERGIVYCGTRAWTQSTTELTWALIMGLIRPVQADDAVIRAGGWQTRLGADLAGRTLGLVGLGRQGSAVAQVGLAFGMRVLAWSTNLTSEQAEQAGAVLVSKHELFESSDIVSLHLVLSDRSRGIVGRPELSAMPAESYLVNSARAGLIDQDALRAAVTEQRLAGVALDVFDIEPLPHDHWLRSSPRTLLSPHMGYVSAQSYRTFYGDVVEDIAAYLSGAPIRLVGGSAK